MLLSYLLAYHLSTRTITFPLSTTSKNKKMIKCRDMKEKGQAQLFDIPLKLPRGLLYRLNFITSDEEAALLKTIKNLPFSESHFGEYRAKRRIIHYGWGYDFKKERLVPGPPLPLFLHPLQTKIAKWLDIPKQRIAHALITEYPKGAPIGWHRDREKFGMIIGISLAGTCRMRWRPALGEARPDGRPALNSKSKKNIISLDLEPRSAYVMSGPIRWRWQHSIPPTKELRYSITFRTIE